MLRLVPQAGLFPGRARYFRAIVGIGPFSALFRATASLGILIGRV
jgi:hypothetical protein